MDTKIVRVGDVMRTTLHKINGLATVQEAIAEMGRLGVGSLIIERRNEDDEYGMITVKDIAAKVVSANRSVARTSVYEVMIKPVMTLGADMNVKYAIRLLSRLGLTRALVVREDELLGLVTVRDMVLGYVEVEENE